MRRLLLALAVGAAPLLQLAGMVPHPVVPDSSADLLALVAQDPAQWFRIHALSAAAAALSVVSALALASLVASRLATVGAALWVTGGSLLVFAFGAEAHLTSLAADPSLDATAMAALVELEGDSPGLAALMTGFPLLGVGTLLVMAALYRSRVVPRWQPGLVLVGTLTSVAAAPGSDLGPLLFLPSVVGTLALAVTVARWQPAREHTLAA